MIIGSILGSQGELFATKQGNFREAKSPGLLPQGFRHLIPRNLHGVFKNSKNKDTPQEHKAVKNSLP